MLIGLMLFAAVADTTVVRGIPVGAGETLRTTRVGTGRPLVVIPGLIGSAYAFRKIIPPLTQAGLTVIVVEPLGVGWSSRPGGSDYSLSAQARRIGAALDSIGGIGCAPVLAHSLGVAMALRLALLRPDLVCGIVADNGGPVDTAATPSVRKAVRFAFLLKLIAGRGTIRRQVRKGMIETAGDTTWITPEVIEQYIAGPAGDLGAVLRALGGMARAREPLPLASRLAGIKVPVHVLVGGAPRGSGITPQGDSLMRARLPRVEVDTIPRSGLHIHEEQPGVVINAVLEMVKRLNER